MARLTCQKLPPPVDTCTKVGQVLLCDRWEVVKPVDRVCKKLDFLPRDANEVENLELIGEAGGFGIQFALFRL